MALVLNSDLTGQQLAEQVAALAAGKQHRLQDFQCDGRHPLTPAAAGSIMKYLGRCPDKGEVAAREEDMGRARTVQDAAAFRRVNFDNIPGGFYAVMKEDGSEQADFWKVSVSRNSGFRSVKRVIGGGSTQLPAIVEVSRPQQVNALRAIAKAGVESSAELYATLETRCMDCGRQLTDDESIKAMKGPVCRNR